MSTDNPGGGDPVRPFTTDPPAGTPAWHNADYWGHGEQPTRVTERPEIREWATRPINEVGPDSEHARNKRAALQAAAAIWSGNGGYASRRDVEATATWMLDWLNG